MERAPQTKSRFVTVLGWFAAVVGGISLPIRVLGLLAVATHPEAVQDALPEGAHPVQVFAAENLVLISILYLVATVLLFVVGIGLIRRRAWALPAGAAYLLLGALRQASSLFVALNSSNPAFAGLDPDRARFATNILISGYVGSLLWLAFLLWFFCRSSIRSEFAPQGSDA